MKRLGLILAICVSPCFLPACTPKPIEKWGYIDKTGKFVIEPKYELAGDFSEGLAIVALERSYDNPCRCQEYSFGFIDTSGELAITFPYKIEVLQTEFIKFTNGRAVIPAPSSPPRMSDNVIDRMGNIIGESSSLILPQEDARLRPVNLSGKWGYLNKSGAFAIFRFFDDGMARRFAEGMAPVCVGTKWGYIDKSSAMVIQPAFDDAYPFSCGLALVRIGNAYSFIDQIGIIRFSADYPMVHSFSEGFALVRNGWTYGYIDSTGSLAIPMIHEIPPADQVEGRDWSFLDFSEGLAPAYRDKAWGYIDTAGEFQIEPKFTMAGAFHSGWARVRIGEARHYIDHSGNLVLESKHVGFGDFRDDRALVADDPTYFPVEPDAAIRGYIDRSGALVISFDPRREARPFSEGLAWVIPRGESAFCIDTGRKTVFQRKLSEVQQFSDGLALVKIWRQPFGYADPTGNIIIQPRFDGAQHFEDGLARVFVDGVGNGVINEQGQYIIQPEPGYIGSFSAGLFAVRRVDKYGFLDAKGEVKIDFKFDGARDFSEGLCAVGVWTDSLRWGFIDTQGEFVVNPEYALVNDFHGGLAAVQKDRKWGFIDRSGRMTIPATFRWAGSFGDDLAPVQVRGYFDKSGTFHVVRDGG